MRFRVYAQAKLLVKKEVGENTASLCEINFKQAFFGEIVDFPGWVSYPKSDENQKSIEIDFYLLPEEVANNEDPQ